MTMLNEAPARAKARSAAETAAPTLATRREALVALDRAVRTLLQRRIVSRAFSLLPPLLDLTVYDEIYPGMPAAGGHWTVAVRRPMLLMHSVATYTVSLEFDARQRPLRFRVSGASDVASENATLESLDQALVEAQQSGPAVTWAPSFVPGFSL
ncbi:MAG: hypothetical protein HYX51_02760 [Chloroflexi bacterium]|nr:hypothetical protein [Chloroflexota bacterium]